jgi:GH35 family endo-1,4-beta-xylanase
MAQATIGDDVISRIRGEVTARDLIFEKVENEKTVASTNKPDAGGDVKIETAAYVVSRNRAPDARLVVDLKLKHQ